MMMFWIGFGACWIILAIIAVISFIINSEVEGIAFIIIILPVLPIYYVYERVSVWKNDRERKKRGEEV